MWLLDKEMAPQVLVAPRGPDQEENLLIENSVLDTIAESVERELSRLSAARPGLASRVERAGNIVVTHLSCRRQRVIRVRVREGRARFLVSGSGGAVYVVDPSTWSCTCPDHHRRGAGCKHSIACWALWRASARPALPGGVAEDLDGLEHVGEIVGRALLSASKLRSCAGCSDRFHSWDLVEVQESLTYFAGDLLCPGCRHGSDADPLARARSIMRRDRGPPLPPPF